MSQVDRGVTHGIVAESLIGVAFGLQLAVAIVLIVGAILVVPLGLSISTSTTGGLSLGSAELAALAGVEGFVTALVLVLGYVYCYSPAREGDYGTAQTPALVLGILFVVLVVTLPIGILYLLAYGRLSDASYLSVPAGLAAEFVGPKVTTDPSSLPPPWAKCANCGELIRWPAPMCPRCHADIGSIPRPSRSTSS